MRVELNTILGQWSMRTDLDKTGTRLCPVPVLSRTGSAERPKCKYGNVN